MNQKYFKKQDLDTNPSFLQRFIEEGRVMIYPTDTIYGIGGDATNSEVVNRIQKIKRRNANKPFSVLVPSVDWIYQNCKFNEKAEEELRRLPGPYTLLLKLKPQHHLADPAIRETGIVGVRIPDHWLTFYLQKTGIPIISTSVNISGEAHATTPSMIHQPIKEKVDLIIDDGEYGGTPSTIIDLTGEEPKPLSR
jgi:L-threonylcarbamoyladenylate synthase